jgi:hypothetical protein
MPVTCHHCSTIWLQAWSNIFISLHDNPFSFRLCVIRSDVFQIEQYIEICLSVQLGDFVLLVVVLDSVRGMCWRECC